MSGDPIDLDAIEARASMASEFPYRGDFHSSADQRQHDATFVVGARPDVLALVAEVRRLRDDMEEMTENMADALTESYDRGYDDGSNAVTFGA